MKLRVLVALTCLVMVGCMPAYTLKKAGPVPVVNGAFIVQANSAWNALPPDARRTKWEEVWTQNGPLLESVAFIGGLPEGKAVVVQRKKDEKQVPLFRANMTPEDLTSMIEASYRTKGVTVFNVESVNPVQFLGGPGMRVRFNYAPGDGITKLGDCVLRVIDKKLYVMKLDGVSSHYFSAAMPEFDLLVASAALSR